MRLLVTSLLLALPLAAQASLVRFAPIADATADQDQPAVNFGSDPELHCGKDFTSTPQFRVWFTRGHLQFDLTSLVGRPLPDRARLRLYQHRTAAAGCLDVAVHRVTAAWSESTITWQNKPPYDFMTLGTVCVGANTDNGWKSVDVTSAVHGWLNGTFPNFGLVVRDPSETTAGAARPLYCHSRDTLTPALMPQLEVAWGTFPFGTGCGPSNPPMLDLDSGSPGLGQSYVLRATGLGGSAGALWFLGRSNTSWGGFPLPFDLTAAGFPGCFLHVSGQIITTGQVDIFGRAPSTFPVPNDPSLVGGHLYHQVASVDQNLALAMTNGFQVTLF